MSTFMMSDEPDGILDMVQTLSDKLEHMAEFWFDYPVTSLAFTPANRVLLVHPGVPLEVDTRAALRVWQDTIVSSGEPAISAEGQIAVLTLEKTKLRLLSPAGKLLGTLPLPGPAQTSPVVDSAGRVYLAAGNQLLALNQSGEVELRYQLPAGEAVSPVVIAGSGRVAVAVGQRLMCLGD